MRDLIKSELKVLSGLADPSNIPHNKQVKSFVFFNATKEKEQKIKEIITSEFSLIESELKALREKEIKEILKSIDWVNEKYSDLIDRYNGTTVQQDIFQWADVAYKHEYERILGTPTRLKVVTDNLYLQDINLIQFFENKKDLDLLNDTLNFHNLYRYHHDKDFQKHYTPTDDERKYDELNEKIHATQKAKYIYCYNINISTEVDMFESLFKNVFKWDHLYWSVFCLPISQVEFENIASDFLKTELYYNRHLIDVNENRGSNRTVEAII